MLFGILDLLVATNLHMTCIIILRLCDQCPISISAVQILILSCREDAEASRCTPIFNVTSCFARDRSTELPFDPETLPVLQDL